MKKILNKTYEFRYATNWESKDSVKVIKRTKKTVTFLHNKNQSRAKIRLDMEGNEYFLPLGLYSMAPTVRA
jgi:hypothetical protein